MNKNLFLALSILTSASVYSVLEFTGADPREVSPARYFMHASNGKYECDANGNPIEPQDNPFADCINTYYEAAEEAARAGSPAWQIRAALKSPSPANFN